MHVENGADGLSEAGADACGQVAGRRRVLLVSPEYAHRGMYTFPLHHPYDGYAMPDLDRPGTAAWPLLKRIQGQNTILQPGDALFVPAYWHVSSAAHGCS